MSNKAEEDFHNAMKKLYTDALNLNPPYKSPRFLDMLNDHGGKETANRLLASSAPSTGFTELFLRGKDSLKLSVEYLVLMNPWNELFTEQQLEIARKRLIQVECPLPNTD